jgi:hypothetical protein
LGAKENGVEIGRQDAPPFLLGELHGAAGMRHARIIDEDGHRAERLLGGVERGGHCPAIAHIRLDGKRLAAGFFDPRVQSGQPVRPARHQHDRCAVLGQDFGETHAEPA